MKYDLIIILHLYKCNSKKQIQTLSKIKMLFTAVLRLFALKVVFNKSLQSSGTIFYYTLVHQLVHRHKGQKPTH